MTENGSKIDPQALSAALGDANGMASVLGGVPEALGASLGRPGDALGRLLAALGSPGASQDRLWGSIWASESRPERVWMRPRGGFGHPKRPEIDFSSNCDGFGMDFR